MSDTDDPRATTPVMVKAPVGGDTFEIHWADGVIGVIPNELLRGYCPCAGCQGHSGNIAYHSGNNSVIGSLEEVGAYALSFAWGDGHSSGIYTFRYLRRLSREAERLREQPDAAREPIARSST